MNDEAKLVFDQLGRALKALQEVVDEPVTEKRIVIDATIQRFEFTIELFWKALKKLLFIEFGIEVHGPKKVLQQAYSNKIIDDEAVWIAMLDDRNMTSHTYEQDLADAMYTRIKTYVPVLRRAYDKLVAE